jgi:hypothetical protein
LDNLIPDFAAGREFVFQGLAREFVLFIPPDNLPQLQTLEVSFYGAPELDSGYGVNDVRFQVNGRDITEILRAQLTAQLQALANPDFSTQYSNAMDLWLAYRNAFGVLPEWLAAQNAEAAQLAQSPPAQLLATLGNKNSGDGGHLDILNFIYRMIPLAPINIRAALTPEDLNASIVIKVSSGPSWSSDVQSWTPDKSYGRGGFCLSLRVTFADPLVGELATIETEVTDSLQDLSSRIASAGSTAQDIQTALTQLSQRVDDCTQTVGDPAIVSAILQSVGDIKKALNIP